MAEPHVVPCSSLGVGCGLFTLTSDYAIVVSPLVQRADSRKFEMLSLDGRRMQIPRREVLAPHRAALEWHQRERVSGVKGDLGGYSI